MLEVVYMLFHVTCGLPRYMRFRALLCYMWLCHVILSSNLSKIKFVSLRSRLWFASFTKLAKALFFLSKNYSKLLVVRLISHFDFSYCTLNNLF